MMETNDPRILMVHAFGGAHFSNPTVRHACYLTLARMLNAPYKSRTPRVEPNAYHALADKRRDAEMRRGVLRCADRTTRHLSYGHPTRNAVQNAWFSAADTLIDVMTAQGIITG